MEKHSLHLSKIRSRHCSQYIKYRYYKKKPLFIYLILRNKATGTISSLVLISSACSNYFIKILSATSASFAFLIVRYEEYPLISSNSPQSFFSSAILGTTTLKRRYAAI